MVKHRVLLINPPEIEYTGFNNPPLALLYLAGTLKNSGVKVKVLDGFFCGWKGIKNEIKMFKPTIVGTTCLTVYRFSSYKILEIAKMVNPQILTILGGVHATMMHTQIIENYPFVDAVVRGEGEQTLLKIAQGKSLEKTEGVTCRRDNKFIVNKPQQYVKNLDRIPFPAWEMVDLTKYAPLPAFVNEHNGIDFRKTPRIPIIFSRGCPGQCNFCSTWMLWRGWRGRSGKNMADEIELLYKKFGMKHFIFCDDCMTVNIKETIIFCDEIIKRNLKIAFNVQTRTDTVNAAVLEKLKQAGCYCVSYGIESGSSKILKIMDKSNTLANSVKAITLTKKIGIKVSAQMITGALGETLQTLNQSIRFLQKTNPEFVVTLGGLWVYPGTKIYHYLKTKGKINDDYWLKPNPPMVFRSHFSERQIRYFRINMERNKLINPHKKVWNSLSFLIFFYLEKLTRKNRKVQSFLIKFYTPINRFIQQIIN